MRSALLVIFVIAVLGCQGGDKSPKSKAQAPQSSTNEVVVYIDTASSQKLVKHFPIEPDPAEGAQDRSSCQRAGGDWGDSYAFGALILRQPQKGAVKAGKMCWSKKAPKELADAGKLCNGQADCIGNCIAETQSDGKWSRPECQKYAEEPVCGPIYDQGRYHWIDCPIP